MLARSVSAWCPMTMAPIGFVFHDPEVDSSQAFVRGRKQDRQGGHGHDLAAERVSVACCQVGSTQPSISIRYEPAPAVIRSCRMSGTTPAAVAKSAWSCRMVR